MNSHMVGFLRYVKLDRRVDNQLVDSHLCCLANRTECKVQVVSDPIEVFNNGVFDVKRAVWFFV